MAYYQYKPLYQAAKFVKVTEAYRVVREIPGLNMVEYMNQMQKLVPGFTNPQIKKAVKITYDMYVGYQKNHEGEGFVISLPKENL